MAFYLQRENYFRELASTHASIKHNQLIVEENLPRQSFFRINDEEELSASCKNWIHFPCLAMIGLSGGLVDKSKSIRQGTTNVLMFLHKLELDAAEPITAAAISVAYEKTFEIMQDFIAKILYDFEEAEDDSCSVFKDINEGSFKWEQYGPTQDELYGWILEFRDETKPPKFNESKWNVNAPETVFILADENGNPITDENGNTIKI